MIAVYIILIIIAVIMLLMLISADLIICISYNNSKMMNDINIRYAFLKFKISPSDGKKSAEKKEDKPDSNDMPVMKLIKSVYTELKDDIKKLGGYIIKRAVRIKELNISAKFGVGDPMYTGILSGTVNAAVYNAVAFLDRHMTLDKWNVLLDADFDNVCLDAGVYIKIRTRILYAVRLGIMAIPVLRKLKKINRRIKEDGR